ncbi:MAG TPA: sugar phosphate isomerase/epimerase family protein [Bacillota bacterium]
MIKQLGISSWSYHWAVGISGYPAPQKPLTPIDLVEKAHELGVGVVQIANNLPLHKLDTIQLDHLRAAAQHYGIEIEVGTSGVEPAHLRKYLEIAKFLNSKLLRTLTHSAESRPDLPQIEEWLREVLPDFAEADVVIAVENYERHSAKELAELIRRINHPYLGVCLDTVNNFGALEGPDIVLAELAPYVLNLHIKDFGTERLDTGMGFIITGRPAGEGRLNVPKILEVLNKNKRPFNMILELWPPYQGDIEASIANEAEWVKRSITYLKSLLEPEQN